ncbi:hypothetical protein K458DRAFT_345189 [Lentithecium fluviatile CBS 122367]|uniref:RTA1 domain protein n=1 Tax=Lentithecium fluviatile CBS 122367 TaxID=1168545 RepID=A0A6G1IRN1_9PLEO|nr:hypothetical protein K458DRAFT_345189 [Lentithecium fluviatile CBS 122367]
MPDGRPVEGSVWFYEPSKVAPAIFATLFLLTGLWHTYQCSHYRAWKITGLHPFCCTLFIVGFAVRVYGAWDIDNVTVLIVSTICIYSAPPILELANYHVLGRILYYIPYHAPLHPGRTLTTFGTLSFFVELLNGLGVAFLTNPNIPQSRQDLGHILMKTALITQIFVMLMFVAIVGVFHRRCRKSGIKNKNVDGVLVTMYISTFYIMTRTVYRVVEHFGVSRAPADPGPAWDPMTLSPVVRYEYYFYIFEAGLMLSNSLLWNTRHPRRHLPQDYHVYLAQDGVSEMQGPGWSTEQSWLMTFIDPFGWFAGKKGPKQKQFWEENGYGGGNGHEEIAYGGAEGADVPLVRRERQEV